MDDPLFGVEDGKKDCDRGGDWAPLKNPDMWNDWDSGDWAILDTEGYSPWCNGVVGRYSSLESKIPILLSTGFSEGVVARSGV